MGGIPLDPAGSDRPSPPPCDRPSGGQRRTASFGGALSPVGWTADERGGVCNRQLFYIHPDFHGGPQLVARAAHRWRVASCAAPRRRSSLSTRCFGSKRLEQILDFRRSTLQVRVRRRTPVLVSYFLRVYISHCQSTAKCAVSLGKNVHSPLTSTLLFLRSKPSG